MIQNSPAHDAFCDTSFLLAYYFAFGEMHDINNGLKKELPFPSKFFPHYKQIENTIAIAEKIFSYDYRLSLVYNFGILSELIEKLGENNLRNEMSPHIPLLLIQNRSKKNYSALAKCLIDNCKRLDELNQEEITPLQGLVYSCFALTDFEFMETGLWGIELVKHFREIEIGSRLNDLTYFSRCQIGFADIHHLLSAQSLGCKYFFTYDSDFSRMKEEIKRTFGLKVITDSREILKVI